MIERKRFLDLVFVFLLRRLSLSERAQALAGFVGFYCARARARKGERVCVNGKKNRKKTRFFRGRGRVFFFPEVLDSLITFSFFCSSVLSLSLLSLCFSHACSEREPRGSAFSCLLLSEGTRELLERACRSVERERERARERATAVAARLKKTPFR